MFVFFFSSRRRHTRFDCDWSSDVCSSDLNRFQGINIDFENMPPEDYALYIQFLQRVRAAFAPSHLLVSADLEARTDRKSTRLNSSHSQISYAVFCLKKKKRINPSRC